MTWQLASAALIFLVLAGGFLWYERSRPSARIVAAVAALAALAVAGRVALAPIPNVVATTDVVLLTGYCLGPAPGFAVGALAGLISNFWLGQGPWTPWQMAGWGLVGIGGGALAIFTARRLGRVGLAVVAAISGFAYGALLDLSVLVSYGGEQSLDRYLALSARAIPFNIAHAAGNAALMLAVGPAMLRMLDRFRTRLEIDWQPLPGRSGAGAAAAALVLGVFLVGSAHAPPSAEAREPASAIDEAAAYLIEAQNPDGGFGIAPGADSSAGMTGWAMLGLESAGINPLDVRNDNSSPVDYLEANAGEVGSTGDIERTILALEAAGLSSRHLAGRDLVAELLDKRREDGSYQRQVNLSAYAILALRAAGVSSDEYGRTAAWLRKARNEDGGWGSFDGAASEPDSTGAVLQALAVAPGDHRVLRQGADWLREAQLGDGGYALTSSAGSNSQSTAWAVQGLVAAGVSPGSVRSGGASPLDYLAARQAGDGQIAYSDSSDQTPVWVTAQGASAIAERAFPLAVVGRLPGGTDGGGGSGGFGSNGNGGNQGEGLGGGSGLGAGTGEGDGGAAKGNGGTANSNGGNEGEGGRGSGGGGKDDGGAAEATAADVEPPLAAEGLPTGEAADDSGLPSTVILLLGLGGLGLVLAGGWLYYRRRLP